MHPADGVIIAIILVSAGMGLVRGLVQEAFSLAGWIAALLVARTFYPAFDAMLVDSVSTPSLRHLFAYAGLFIGTLVVARLLGYAVMSLIDVVGLKWPDRFLGGIFGAGRGLILVLSLLILMQPYVDHDPWWHEAQLPRAFMQYAYLGKELRDDVEAVAMPTHRRREHQQSQSQSSQ